MIFGLIGERLSHSFSAEIHAQIGGYPYELLELAPRELDGFLRARPFSGINVTIPYKQRVIPYLDEISGEARRIGAVNTIVNRGGRLVGYNTDFDGLTQMLRRAGIACAGRRALVLGTGGTSRTACRVLSVLGAREILRVSRTAREGALTYEEAAARGDAEVILNATPCGMYPETARAPISLSPFPRLCGAADVIYNPLRTRLVLEARARGVPHAGGLFMLVAQAVRASEIFLGRKQPGGLAEAVHRSLLRSRENLVLIGMPGSGKSVLSAALGRALGREVLDTDALVEAQAGMRVPEIFRLRGEAGFRELESRVIASLAPRQGLVIATGGGAVLRGENVAALRLNGRLFWLDRPPEELVPTPDRPLADTREKIAALYRARAPLYRAAADETVAVRGGPRETAEEIEGRWNA